MHLSNWFSLVWNFTDHLHRFFHGFIASFRVYVQVSLSEQSIFCKFHPSVNQPKKFNGDIMSVLDVSTISHLPEGALSRDFSVIWFTSVPAGLKAKAKTNSPKEHGDFCKDVYQAQLLYIVFKKKKECQPGWKQCVYNYVFCNQCCKKWWTAYLADSFVMSWGWFLKPKNMLLISETDPSYWVKHCNWSIYALFLILQSNHTDWWLWLKSCFLHWDLDRTEIFHLAAEST